MKRRHWLAASAFAGLSALGASRSDSAAQRSPRQFYSLKRYQLRNGPQQKLVDDFLREAAVPALNRAGARPVGVLYGIVGPENPSVYVLVPHPSLEAFATIDAKLSQDAEFRERGAAYFDAPATHPAYVRFEISLLEAFESFPRIEAPPTNEKRIFELRTYENPSEKANLTKLQMFNTAEISIFRHNGFRPVFFGNTLFGDRMPKLTYMLTFRDLEERQARWTAFGADPAWKKLSTTRGYTDPEIITNITNSFLNPAPYSQI